MEKNYQLSWDTRRLKVERHGAAFDTKLRENANAAPAEPVAPGEKPGAPMPPFHPPGKERAWILACVYLLLQKSCLESAPRSWGG